ncbi:OTOP2 protein, partial [Atractosteus spatula]|nr:OTOP2 protein [Atractosteus spatula]
MRLVRSSPASLVTMPHLQKNASYQLLWKKNNVCQKMEAELNEGCPCPNTMVAVKRDEAVVGDPLRSSSLPENPSSSPPREKGRNRGRLISCLITVNILFLGCALVSGGAFNEVAITQIDVQIYLTVLLLLNTSWMIFYVAYTSQVDSAILYKDSHAGPIWLRGGLVLFGVCSLIMDIFKIANYIGYMHCDSAVKVVFPVVQAVFILMQTYFLWVHAKDCVQIQRNITRCGLMLTLACNLMVWMAAVTDESLHQTGHKDSSTRISNVSKMKAANPSVNCQCSYESCPILEKGYYYLYPFNIEYSLFASAMAYVMWKNVGRQIDEHSSHHHVSFHIRGILAGPVLGIIVVVTGLAVFVVYDVEVNSPDTKDLALLMYYVMNIVGLILMSAASLAGSIIYRYEKRDHVSNKNPTRSLDIALLLGASMGQFTICYFTIVAVVAKKSTEYLFVLDLVCAIIIVVELCLQNLFIIEGLHRQPFNEESAVGGTVFINDNAFRQGGCEGARPAENGLELSHSPVHTMHSMPSTLPSQSSKYWRRRALKEISSFLLLCNIIFWVMPAFGARPQFDNKLGIEFYKLSMWTAIVNIGLPFGIFYRMHSVASLFEVFLTS